MFERWVPSDKQERFWISDLEKILVIMSERDPLSGIRNSFEGQTHKKLFDWW